MDSRTRDRFAAEADTVHNATVFRLALGPTYFAVKGVPEQKTDWSVPLTLNL
jgi:hypothetical protein